jgi:hypothetical protein
MLFSPPSSSFTHGIHHIFTPLPARIHVFFIALLQQIYFKTAIPRSFIPRLRGILCLFLVACTAAVLNAQFDSGSILGTVRDASGAVVPEASITLRSLGTGVPSTTLSNSAGDYSFNSVPSGDYVVAVKCSGFKDATTSTITVTVGARLRVDLNLVLANVTQQVVVNARPALLETDSSDRSMVINPTEVVNLPLNGRDPKTVVRAAYGIGYQQFIRAAVVNELAQNAPYNIDHVISQYTPYSKTSPEAVCTSLSAAPLSCFQPTQLGYVNNFLSASNYSALSTTTTYDTAHTPTTYMQSYQLSVQRELTSHTVPAPSPSVETSGYHQPGWSGQPHPPHLRETRVTQPAHIFRFTVAATNSRSYQHIQ